MEPHWKNVAASHKRENDNIRQTKTYAAKVLVQQLHISVDDLQCDELIVLVLYCTAEIQAGISANTSRPYYLNSCIKTKSISV